MTLIPRTGEIAPAIESEPIAWQPSPAYIERSRLRLFCRNTGNHTVSDLRTWAAQDPGRYWDAVVKDLELTWYRPYTAALNLDGSAAWAEWFTGGVFNYVTNAVDRHAHGSAVSRAALVWEGDDGDVRTLTFGELLAEVNRFANALKSIGVAKGDTVGIFLPMVPESAIATLACGKIGAIFIPLFSGYGEEAIASRLRDSGARVLITADAFSRRGKKVPMKAIADAALLMSPTVETCVVLQRMNGNVAWSGERDKWWHELIAEQSPECQTVETAANDPYMIIYTSGTTGRPKGAVHVHAGFPIKAAHDLAYCFDVHSDDTIFWLTDLGWMMGPWLIAGGLMLGATILLFEGTPDYPQPDRLWQMVERHNVTVFGIAPTAIRALKSLGPDWVRKHDLSTLRVLGSTGETWNPDPWWWYFKEVGGEKCPIINYSGGTETGGDYRLLHYRADQTMFVCRFDSRHGRGCF